MKIRKWNNKNRPFDEKAAPFVSPDLLVQYSRRNRIDGDRLSQQVEIMQCPYCHCEFGVDWSFIDLENVVHCPACCMELTVVDSGEETPTVIVERSI